MPNEDYFPAAFNGSEPTSTILLDQVCEYIDVDPASVDLLFYSERQRLTRFTEIVRPDRGAAGLYSKQNGRTTIWLEVSHLADPITIVATFAHELCHAHLLGGGRISSEEADHEPLTDLATIYFGMGIFTANASLRQDKTTRAGNSESWSISRQGYLTNFGLRIGAVRLVSSERGPDWAGHLRLDVRSPFWRRVISPFQKISSAFGRKP